MFNKKMKCVAALSAGIILCSADLYAKEHKNYEVSVYSTYRSLQVNTTAADKTTATLNKLFPGWVVTTDKLNGAFTDMYGEPVSANGNTNSDKAQQFLSEQLKKAGIKGTEWAQVSALSARKADYVNFTQVINGHPVVYSWLSFRFTKTGELSRVQIRNHGTPASDGVAKLTAEDAKKAALRDLGGVTVKSAEVSQNWEWYPVPTATGYNLHAAWHFEIDASEQASLPLNLTGYIDATNGNILERTNEVRDASAGYDLTVKGMVYKNGTLLPATLEPLTDLELMIDTFSSPFYTDVAGVYNSGGLVPLPAVTDIKLKGKWATVIDSVTSAIPDFSNTVSIPGTTFTYPTTAPSSNRHVNAYYHVGRVHNFMKDHFPLFTGMDFSLPTYVDISAGSCNAFYNKSKINFYSASAGCNSFAEIGDIIYHEYGHGISDIFYKKGSGSSMRNGSLNEACSDIWAMSITHDPVLGANAFVGYGGFIRRYDMMPQVYPMDLETNTTYADVHKNGQIIAGCWWDVAINLGSVDSMAQLFTDVYFDFPDGATGKEGTIFQNILVNALTADDDDANILNGTPHYAQIVAAFAKHGIYLGGEVKMTHTELTHQPPFTPITVNARISMTTKKYAHDVTLYYRANGGTWNPLVMADSAMTVFIATIPGQSMGAVLEYYFIMHDSMNTPIAYFPTTCNPALPGNQATIPYQFGVGIHSNDANDFESVVSGWLIGSNKGDDATTKWRQVVPVKNKTFTNFPSGDHTNDSGKCLITGSGASGTFGAGVAGGTSTVLSPLFSIGRFTMPVVEYYRWFSNEQGYQNFKNDPWIVKVRNSPTASWTTIENTYQGDNNWRRRIFRANTYLPVGSTQLQMMYIISDSVISTWADDGQSVTVGGIDDFFIYDIANTLETPALPATKAEVYPNPADNRIQIVLQAGSIGTATLYDMLGRNVAEVSINANTTTYSMDTRNLAPEQYNLVLQTNFSVQSKKIAVVHN